MALETRYLTLSAKKGNAFRLSFLIWPIHAAKERSLASVERCAKILEEAAAISNILVFVNSC